MFKIIVKLILVKKDSFVWALKLSPIFIGMASFVVALSFLFKTPPGKQLLIETWAALLVAFILAIIIGYMGMTMLRRFIRSVNGGGTE